MHPSVEKCVRLEVCCLCFYFTSLTQMKMSSYYILCHCLEYKNVSSTNTSQWKNSCDKSMNEENIVKTVSLCRYKSKPYIPHKHPWQLLTTHQDFLFTVVGSTDYTYEATVFWEIRGFFRDWVNREVEKIHNNNKLYLSQILY